MNKSPTRPQILDGEAAQIASMPYVIESTEFRAYVHQKRTEAVRKRDDLMTEIDRLNTEIEVRTMRVTDLDEIVARADAALMLDMRTIGAAPEQAALDVGDEKP